MTPRELAEYVAGTMGDVSVTVSISDVTVEDANLVVDFKEDSEPARYANARVRLHRPFPVIYIFFPSFSFCSNSTTLCPCSAATADAIIPAAPPPTTYPIIPRML